MNIRPVSGCVVGKGIFASFAHYEENNILPLRLVTDCRKKYSKNCSVDLCPRFKTGLLGSHNISWQNEGARM